ncbi:MAG TPA: hypothetical protein VNF68_09155 [Candidatus Baltobacteraceae bacterium]|nr:hypothetical protein [Candidatus Baltobacteraceae bacterium]
MNIVARVVLALITAFVLVAFYVPLGHADFAGRWGDGTYGVGFVQAQTQDGHVESVRRDSPAWRAGIRIGDLLVGRPFGADFSYVAYPRAGDRGHFTFSRGGKVFSVDMVAVPRREFAFWNRLSGVLAIVPATVFFAIAFVLVFLRPSVMTWCFLAYAIGYYSTAPTYEYFASVLPTHAYIAMTFVLTTFCGNFAVMPLLPFIIRFPDDRLSGFRKSVDNVVWVAIAAAFAAYAYQWFAIWSGQGSPPTVAFLNTWLPLITFVVATIMLVKKYKHASPEVRQRFGFLILGLVVSFIAYATYFVPGVPAALAQLIGYAVVAMPICVAYAVFRHRVLDINFVLNRTLTYGILSLFVIAFISLLDWSLSHVVSGERLTTGVELGVTIGIGFLLDRINKLIERVVETVFFRARRSAEQYLKRAASALPYATEESAVSDGLVQVPADALSLGAAALYRRSADGSRFEGVATSMNTPIAPPGFERNHLLVRMLQSDEERVWLDPLRSHLDAENASIYVLAVPVSVRHELVSFTLYGAHANGAQLDSEEVDMLEELAREASRAYDHIEAVRTRERYAGFSVPIPGTA